MLSIRRIVRGLLALLGAVAVFAAEPAVAQAGWEAWNPVPFTEPLALSRGRLEPGPGGATLGAADYCRFVTGEWGWPDCDGIEAFAIDPVPGLGILLAYAPGPRGYVRLDDWHAPGRHDQVRAIEAELRETFAEQALRLGRPIEFVRWRSYPTLNAAGNYLYYATDVRWDGAPHTNIRAAVFDRRGYVVFDLVPEDPDIGRAAIERLIEASLERYRPAEDYGAFRPGDPVAPVGAVGVLAALVGVGPAATAAQELTAMAPAGLGKAWLAVFLIPLIWLGRLFRG